MNKLETFTLGESSHVPTFLSGESIYRCLMNFYLRNLLIIVNQRGWKKSIRLVTLNTANSIVSLDRSKRFILKEKIMILVSEGKIIIVQDETAEANNASVETNQQKCSRLLFMPNTTFLRFGSLALIWSWCSEEKTWGFTRYREPHRKWNLCLDFFYSYEGETSSILRIRLPKTR